MSGMESLPALAERREKKMRKKRTKQGMSNSAIAGVDLGGSDSLATVLSPGGEVADRFSFPMTEEGYALFSSRVSKDARVAFEATLMAHPFSREAERAGLHRHHRRPPHRARVDRQVQEEERQGRQPKDSEAPPRWPVAGVPSPREGGADREGPPHTEGQARVGDRQDEEQRPELPHEGRGHPVAP